MHRPAAAQPRSHRKAFGAQRVMSPAIKARNVAESIRLRIAEGRDWHWSDYGLAEQPAMIALITTVLEQGS
jgi:hypothetical protein